MNRTKVYYDTVVSFRENLRKISKDYNAGLSRIEKYKGSPAYDEELKVIEKKRKADIEQAQQQARQAFAGVLSGMREAATSRPMIAPTPEILSLLQVLKMRKEISIDELQQAARTVGECPVALSVLDELAREHEYMGYHFGRESTDSILKHINSLTASARKIIRMEAVDRKREMIDAASPYSENYDPAALELFSVDRDFISEQDALASLGGVFDFDSFSKAVN